MTERMEEGDMGVEGRLFEMRDDLTQYICYWIGAWYDQESTVKKEEEEP